MVSVAYKNFEPLTECGQHFLGYLNKTLSFECRQAWYPALRMADVLLREGHFTGFRKLVCEASCRRDPAFQWGLCQRLGDLTADSKWDPETRQNAVALLGEVYRNDAVWGQQATVKQWIVDVLMQVASVPHAVKQTAEAVLRRFGTDKDTTKQALYQSCLKEDPSSYPLRVASPSLATPSLLDRVQDAPDVETRLRRLRRQRLKEWREAMYVPLQARANQQTSDKDRFLLMDRVKEFLDSDQKVFVLLGDCGSGKSTFNHALECDLWNAYKKVDGHIPLHIDLTVIDNPKYDLIGKQLSRIGFMEAQIMDMKLRRKFIVICDQYNDISQLHNFYTSNQFNRAGEWSATMMVSCRTENLVFDNQLQPGLFQQAVIAPFSEDQVQYYIDRYLFTQKPPWSAEQFLKSIHRIQGLRDQLKNPLLLSLFLDVFPYMIDPGRHPSTMEITRLAFYDILVEHWLERSKRRLEKQDLNPQERAAFELLTIDGFTMNCINYMKKLAVAIYMNQHGNPVVAYSRFEDEGTWKGDFFGWKDEKQLLCEACLLTRSGNQYQFIHPSLLEYGLALAIFDPRILGKIAATTSTLARRGNVVSGMNFEHQNVVENAGTSVEHVPDIGSPLYWRSFVNEPSILQFLEERVQQEILFKKQLLAIIEHSKTDMKWCTAAANAITILVRAGVQFIEADLRGIRIPGADLSHGIFDSAQLQGADLRK
ncbi:hypothetical protein BGZ65_008956, partial [Modicella reniformis]